MKQPILNLTLSSVLLILAGSAHSNTTEETVNKLSLKNDYLRFSTPINIDALNPILSINAHSKFILPLVYKSLITLNLKQELKPTLAKSWRVLRETNSIIISINKNHHFSDNTEATAQDVVESFYRLCSPESQESGQIRGLLGCEQRAHGSKTLPQVFALNRYNVQFNINSNPTTFLTQLSFPSTEITKQTPKGLIGSGPYAIERKERDSLTLGKNPYYFGNVHVMNSGIIFFYTSGRSLANRIKQYKFDGGLMYRLEDISKFSDNNYSVIRSNPNITEMLVLNTHKFPFNHKIVRNALAAEFYNSFSPQYIPGSHKAYGIIPNGIGGSLANKLPKVLHPISPDDVFAKVPELGHQKVYVTIHLLNDIKNNYVVSQLFKSARKFHIEIKYVYHKNYSDLLPHYLKHNLDGVIDLYIFKNREANSIFEFFTRSGENDANVDNDRIDTMIKAAVNASSSHGRFQNYRKLAQYIQDENIIIPIFYMDHGNIISKQLVGISDNFIFNPYLELPNLSKLNHNEE